MSAAALEPRLARLLGLGVWAGSVIVAVGFLVSLRLPVGVPIEMAGVAVFILLPILRVALMAATWARQRERLFAGAAALVLAVIALSAVVGLHSPH
ncbi:MAG: DUF1634 domain-containing protein [Caulobacteraceae bacterium]